MAAAMAVLSACGPGVPQLGKSSLDEVIGAMTLEEKAHLVVGTGMAGFSGDSAVIGATRKLVPGAAGTTYPIERLGIPAVVLADGPAGLRIDPKREGDSATYYCTHFPIGTLLMPKNKEKCGLLDSKQEAAFVISTPISVRTLCPEVVR